MTDDDKSEGRLSRWSKRKLAVANEEAEVDGAVERPDAESVAAQEAELQARLQANREAAEAVDLDSLDEESDFSVFMKAGVPELLKKRAMASLWRTSPVFANVDGLVDYDDDFGSPDLIMKTFKSAYEIGKGYFDEDDEDDEDDEGEDGEDGEDKSDSEVDETAAAEPVDESASDLQNDDEDLQTGEPEEPVDLAQKDADVVQEDVTLSEAPDMEQEHGTDDPSPPKISLRRRLDLEQSS
ncbi:MAG: DUF3306 domain-containing protein [Rhizobiaceae bacterium]